MCQDSVQIKNINNNNNISILSLFVQTQLKYDSVYFICRLLSLRVTIIFHSIAVSFNIRMYSSRSCFDVNVVVISRCTRSFTF